MKKYLSLVLTLVLVLTLAACNKNDDAKDDKAKEDEKKTEEQVGGTDKKDEPKGEASDFSYVILRDNLDALIANSKSVDEFKIPSEKVVVKQGGDIVPGVYDLEILEGNGNIIGTRVDFFNVPMNWIGQKKEESQSYPSKYRVILLEGDEIEFLDVQTIKLTAVKEFSSGLELHNGNYIVGKDIPEGKYKFSTNIKMDPEYGALGWTIEVYNPAEDEDRDVYFTPDQSDSEVELVSGEIITVSCDSFVSQEGLNPDDAILSFVQK